MKAFSSKGRNRSFPLIIMVVIICVLVLTAFSHKVLLCTKTEDVLATLNTELNQKYAEEIEINDIRRRIDFLSPQNDFFEAICIQGTTLFCAKLNIHGKVTDSFGVSHVEQRLKNRILSCAATIAVDSKIEHITWRSNGIYLNDSEQSAYYEIDPNAPLNTLNRIEKIGLKNISSVSEGVAVSKQLLEILNDEVDISLEYVEFVFKVNNSYCHFATSTNMVSTATAEDVFCYLP